MFEESKRKFKETLAKMKAAGLTEDVLREKSNKMTSLFMRSK